VSLEGAIDEVEPVLLELDGVAGDEVVSVQGDEVHDMLPSFLLTRQLPNPLALLQVNSPQDVLLLRERGG